jgi:hypothetical protein
MTFKGKAELNQFLYQLHHLYSTSGTYGLYDIVYDKLVEDCHEVKFSKEVKDDLWTKARIKFNKENKRLITKFKENKWPEDRLKALLNKQFKSMLAAKYLMDKVPTEGCILIEDFETGKRIKFLNIVGYK